MMCQTDVGSTGQKRAALVADLPKLYEQLRQRLAAPRLDRLDGRTQAVFESEVVRVLHKDGKFKNFGYNRDGKHFLEYYEAMFLLEVNRLHLAYASMVVSVEQAYLLLLGETASVKYDIYNVYSHFTRAGYILVKHRNSHFTKQLKPAAMSQTDCIWDLLRNNVENKPVGERLRCSPYYAKTKEDMEQIKESIIVQKCTCDPTTSSDINFNRKLQATGKRKADERYRSLAKRSRQQSHASLIDFFKSEAEFKKFEKIFEQLNIVKLNKLREISLQNENASQINIYFDVHLPNSGFRKSAPNPPIFRIITLGVTEPFPNHDEIAFCYQQQLFPVPLLIVSVSETKQIHAFLCWSTQ